MRTLKTPALLSLVALLSSACAAPSGEASAQDEATLVTCGAGFHKLCTTPDPSELPPGAKRPPPVCTCLQDPTATAQFVRVIGVQPGWVRATFAVSTAGDQADVAVTADVTCDPSTPRQSVRVVAHKPSPTLLAVDVKADLDWLAANGLPLPCKATSIDVSFAWPGGTLATATSPYPFQMDLPLSHLSTTQNWHLQGAQSVSVHPAPASRRHFAYTPQLFMIQHAFTGFAMVEVEELPDRGTVGLRGAALFNWFYNGWLTREVGGGGEIYPGWGFDVSRLSIVKDPLPVEASHPGFDSYAYGGTVVPPLSTKDKTLRIYPAPPLVPEAEYNANVLDNHGVPHCPSPDGCLDVVYDATTHELRAGPRAFIWKFDDGPIQPGVTPTSGAPVVLPLSATTAPPTLVSSRAPAFTPPALPVRTTLSPQEQALAGRALNAPKSSAPIVAGATCALNAAKTGSTGPLTHCGGRTSATHCPTLADPVDVDALPPAPGTGYATSVSRLMPVYANRENVAGTCGTHTEVQYYEALVNKLIDDMVPQRGASIDGEWVAIPEPRLAYSPSAALTDLYTRGGIQSGDPDNGTSAWPAADAHHFMPQFLDAYWPAREPDFVSWLSQSMDATQDPAGKALLAKCQGTSIDPYANWWRREFCVGQGQPPAGAYWNYSTQVATAGQDPLAGRAWSVGNTYFDVKATKIDLTDRDAAIRAMIAALRTGLPVGLEFPVRSSSIAEGLSSVGFPLLNEMSWFLPPELAGCDAGSLQQAFGVHGAHAANIVGYVISGPIDAPDPIASYFLVENNWGKWIGRGGMFAMNFAAFKMLATGASTAKLICGFPSVACTVGP